MDNNHNDSMSSWPRSSKRYSYVEPKRNAHLLVHCFFAFYSCSCSFLLVWLPTRWLCWPMPHTCLQTLVRMHLALVRLLPQVRRFVVSTTMAGHGQRWSVHSSLSSLSGLLWCELSFRPSIVFTTFMSAVVFHRILHLVLHRYAITLYRSTWTKNNFALHWSRMRAMAGQMHFVIILESVGVKPKMAMPMLSTVSVSLLMPI